MSSHGVAAGTPPQRSLSLAKTCSCSLTMGAPPSQQMSPLCGGRRSMAHRRSGDQVSASMHTEISSMLQPPTKLQQASLRFLYMRMRSVRWNLTSTPPGQPWCSSAAPGPVGSSSLIRTRAHGQRATSRSGKRTSSGSTSAPAQELQRRRFRPIVSVATCTAQSGAQYWYIHREIF